MAYDADPRLTALEPLVGEWDMELRFPHGPEVGGSCSFEWTLDGRFLIQRSEVPDMPEAPGTLSMIAPDHTGDGFIQHYFDTRGVVRLYAMTVGGGELVLERTTEDFSPLDFWQRFTGTFDQSGDRITGGWYASHAKDGEWELDFELDYTRVG